MKTELSYADIPVVPLGAHLCLSGWSKDQIQEAIMPNVPTAVLCWHCCHSFSCVPCRLPLVRDSRLQANNNNLNLYYSRGCFCSWNCCKQYALQASRSQTSGASTVALLANRSRRLFAGQRSDATNGIVLRTAGPKEQLKAFGGPLSIDQYRQGFVMFDGTVWGGDPEENVLMGKRQRNCYVAPAFIDNSIVSLVRCCTEGGVLSRTEGPSNIFTDAAAAGSRAAAAARKRPAPGTHLPVPTMPGPAPTSIRDKMLESKRRRQAPTTQRGGSVTLDCSMGIKVRRK